MNNLCEGACLQNGKYKILDTLGVGGFGITYLAEQKSLGRNVAIKEFFMKEYCERSGMTSCVSVPTEGSRSLVERYRLKFIKEAQIIASLNCENIIRIYDIFEENDTAYYVMELINGGSLKDVIEKNGPLTEREAIAAISQIGDALGYLHTRNILHLDIKPSNALIGENNKIKLIDFGISKHYSDDGSQTTSTPAGISKGFAPMEQYLQGTVSNFSPATDVYSLGATLLYLLTGAVPPEAADINENGMPDFSDIISSSTYAAICKAMSPRRKDRPQTVSEFISLLTNDKSKSPSLIPQNNSTSLTNVDSEETTIVKNQPVTLQDKKLFPEPKSDRKKNHSIGCVITGGTTILLLLFVLIIRLCGNTDILNPQEEVLNSTIIAPSILLNGLTSTSVSFSPEGGTEKISLKKNFNENWTCSSIPEWCSIQTSSDSFSLTAKPNYSGVRREASIYFAQKGNEDLLASMGIYQEAIKQEPINKVDPPKKNNTVKNNDLSIDKTAIPYQLVEHKPSFMGGDANTFSSWVASQLQYPQIAIENGLQGRVMLQFTVATDGSVVDVKVLRGVDPVLDQEAVRVVNSSPKWAPGSNDGEIVSVTYTFPVIFQFR